MPVEVRELIIQAKAIANKGSDHSQEQPFVLPQGSQGLSEDEREDIIRECIEAMLEILEDRNKR